MTDIPLIGAKPEQPTFPSLNVQWLPNGALFAMQLGPTLSINQFVDAASMDAITQGWKQHKQQAALIMQAVQNSRNL
jgi:hypothetical protein